MASDNFNRADESPLSGGGLWSSDSSYGGLDLVTNYVSGTSVRCSRYASSSATESNCTMASGSNGAGGPGIHLDGAGSGYACIGSWFGAFGTVLRLDAGSTNFIGGFGTGYTAANVIRLRRSGSDVILSVDGVDADTVTDTTYTGNAPGLFVIDTTAFLDDWNDGAGGGGGGGQGPRSMHQYRLRRAA